MNIVCLFCSAYHWMAEMVLSSPKQRPEFTACCQRNHISLRCLSLPPPLLRQILDSDDVEGREFHTNIYQYNMVLAFTSLGVREDTAVNCRGGWVF
jgi:hypothetical protein